MERLSSRDTSRSISSENTTLKSMPMSWATLMKRSRSYISLVILLPNIQNLLIVLLYYEKIRCQLGAYSPHHSRKCSGRKLMSMDLLDENCFNRYYQT